MKDVKLKRVKRILQCRKLFRRIDLIACWPIFSIKFQNILPKCHNKEILVFLKRDNDVIILHKEFDVLGLLNNEFKTFK